MVSIDGEGVLFLDRLSTVNRTYTMNGNIKYIY